jgi:hypothetical protein
MRKVFIAVPVGDGKLTYDSHESINRATHLLRDKGVEVVPYYHPCHIYIDRARNLCVKKFLESDCQDMVFIDADVGFDNDGIWKLLQHDKDIVAGAYPFRKDNDLGFPVVIEFNEKNNCKDEETGLVYAKMVPSGFMRIQRRVFEKIIALAETSPDHVYKIEKDHEDVYTFFRTGILFKDDNTWYGEDVAFCMWWKAMGGDIFIEPDINFTHTGMKQFQGNFHNYLMGRRVDNWQDVLDHNPTGIDGWIKDNELEILKDLASRSDSVIEIGSWKGRSTKALLESCKGLVYAVDHWEGSKTDLSCLAAASKDIYGEFIKNVGHYPNLRVWKGDSLVMAASGNGIKVDMVFIDADHSYEACKADIEAWFPKCKKVICGHDYSSSFPGVIQAVNEKFDNIKTCGSLWWVEL